MPRDLPVPIDTPSASLTNTRGTCTRLEETPTLAELTIAPTGLNGGDEERGSAEAVTVAGGDDAATAADRLEAVETPTMIALEITMTTAALIAMATPLRPGCCGTGA